MKSGKAAALLLAPEGEEREESGADEEEASTESEDAARDVLAAIKDGDAKALDLALQRHYEACEAKEGDEDADPRSGRY